MSPVGTVCLGMKPTQRKAKPSTEGAEGRELMASFEPTEPPYLEARVHSLLGFHISVNIPRILGTFILLILFLTAKVRNAHTKHLNEVEV